MPVERIIVPSGLTAEAFKVLKATDKIVGVSNAKRPSVFLETGFEGLNDVGTYGEGAKGSLVLGLTGGRNIAANLSEAYPHVDSWIITQNPEVVTKYVYSSEVDWGWNSTDEPEALIEDVLNRDGWESIDAVKNQRVYLVSNELMTGLDSVVGYLYWVKLLHPKFAADPTGAYEEYITDFMGMEFPDLIFVFPNP